MIFSHGRAGTPAELAQLRQPLQWAHVRWLYAWGYAVIAPIRPGYGGLGGDPENAGVAWAGAQCTREPDFHKTAQAAVHATRAAYDWLLAQDWVNKEQIILEGHSVGGLTTVAACSQNWPGVRACINFAGGAGGNPSVSPGKSCAPETMGEVLGSYGSSTQRPSIWLYGKNDYYWGEQAPKLWHEAHLKSAQEAKQPHSASFVGTESVMPDGYQLITRGMSLWSEPLSQWLSRHGL